MNYSIDWDGPGERETEWFDSGAVRCEIDRIKNARQPSDEDKEDLATYARHVVELRAERDALSEQLAEAERERDNLKAAIAESDRQAAKLEALLDPHISWEGQPPAAQTAAESESARLRTRLDEAERVIAAIVSNAELQPDVRMGGTADCYAVPLDDIEAAATFRDGEIDAE